MAYTTSQIDAIIATLESRMAAGTARVRFQDREFQYSTVEQITKAIAYFQGLRDTVVGTSDANPRITRLYSGDGY